MNQNLCRKKNSRKVNIKNSMPLSKNVGKNIKELIKDNKKSGNVKGANGKTRPMKQIIAISLNAAGKSKKK